MKLLNVLEIFALNLVLSGDNGILIAMAVTMLPRRQKLRAISVGAALAVVFQVAATFFAAQLLHFEFIRLIGGVLILWISVNLFRDAANSEAGEPHVPSFWKAIWFIVIADLTMSTDNILAVAAIAKGNLVLLIVGLSLSIPVVVFASGLLSTLMEKYSFIVYLGAAVLGSVGGELIMTDAFTVEILRPGDFWRICVQVASAIAVVVTGRVLVQQRRLVSP
jgi:YjbE family integral membrane protein